MIVCLSVTAMLDFLDLLPPIYEIHESDVDTILIRAEEGDVVWRRVDDLYCISDPSTFDAPQLSANRMRESR